MAQSNGNNISGESARKVTWAQMVRDVLIAAMNKGQLPVFGLLGIIFLWIWKLPSEAVQELSNNLLAYLVQGELWAYALFIIAIVAWFVHCRWVRRTFQKEYQRIGNEKSKLQQLNAKIDFKSSDESWVMN